MRGIGREVEGRAGGEPRREWQGRGSKWYWLAILNRMFSHLEK